MAVSATPVFTQTPKTKTTTSIGSAITIWTVGANGSKVTAISATNTSAGALVMSILVNAVIAWKVTIPANAGFDGTTAATNCMNSTLMPGLPVDNDGQTYIFVTAGETLTATAASGTSLTTTVVGADF